MGLCPATDSLFAVGRLGLDAISSHISGQPRGIGQGPVDTVPLPGSPLRLPHGGTVLEEMLLFHECPEAGLGEKPRRETTRIRGFSRPYRVKE